MKPQTAAFHFLLFITSLLVISCAPASEGEEGDEGSDSGSGSTGGSSTIEYFEVGGVITGNEGDITLSLNGLNTTFSGGEFTFFSQVAENSTVTISFVSSETGETCTVEPEQYIALADVESILVDCSNESLTIELEYSDSTGELATGDFNDDGFPDLAYVYDANSAHPSSDAFTSLLKILYGDGTGQFSQSYETELIRDTPEIEVGFADSDDVEDIYAFEAWAHEVFSSETDNTLTNYFREDEYYISSDVSVADFNNDGYDDYVVDSYNSSTDSQWGTSSQTLLSVFLNNGDGTFSDWIVHGDFRDPEIPDDLKFNRVPVQSVVNYFDDDSYPDVLILVGYYDEPALYLAKGDGDGTFTYPTAVQALPSDIAFGETSLFSWPVSDIASADIDADGDVDIAIPSSTDYLLVLKNDGDGNFSSFQEVVVDDEIDYVGFHYMNNDGYIDLVTFIESNDSLVISMGQPDGTFSDFTDDDTVVIEIEGEREIVWPDVAVSDFDLDGLLDIAVIDSNYGTETIVDGVTVYGRGRIEIFFAPGEY